MNEFIVGEYKIHSLLKSYADKDEERNVYIVLNKSNEKFICKEIIYTENSDIDNEKRKSEYINLKRFSDSIKYPHLNISKYIEHFIILENQQVKEKIKKQYIITEFYDGGDLSSLKTIKNGDIIYLFLKMLIIFKEFQTVIIHRDIKPDNILIKSVKLKDGTIVNDYYLCDLGSSTQVKTINSSTLIGTNQYIAPDVIKRGGYTGTIDIWGLGKTLLLLLNRVQQNQYNKINKILFEMMCSNESTERPTVDQLIEFMVCQYDNISFTEFEDFTHPLSKDCIEYFKNNKLNILKKDVKPIQIKIKIKEKEYRAYGAIRALLRNFYYIDNVISIEDDNNSGGGGPIEVAEFEWDENTDKLASELFLGHFKTETGGKNYEITNSHIEFVLKSEVLKSLSYHDEIVIDRQATPISDNFINSDDNQAQIPTPTPTSTKCIHIFSNHKYNFQKIIRDLPNGELTGDVQLKAIFHLILVIFEIAENGPDFMYNALLEKNMGTLFIIPPSSEITPTPPIPTTTTPTTTPPTTTKTEATTTKLSQHNFKFLFPFRSYAFSHSSNTKLHKFLNIFGDHTKDGFVVDILKFAKELDKTKLPTVDIILKLIKMIQKEKCKLLETYSNSGLDFYFNSFETLIFNYELNESLTKLIDKNKIIHCVDSLNQILTTRYFYFLENHDKYYAIEPYKSLELISSFNEKKNLYIRKLLNYSSFPSMKRFKYIQTYYDKVNNSHYFVFEIPKKLLNTTKKMELTKESSTTTTTKFDRMKIFKNLIVQHLNNIHELKTHLKSIYEYSFNLVISQEDDNTFELYYSNSVSPFSDDGFIRSFYDIGKWVFGNLNNQEEEGDQLVIMINYFSFLRILSELSWFCNILGSGNVHHSIVYNELNIYYYLKMLIPLLNDIEIKVFHYQIQNDIFAKIIIGNTQYNIINLIEPNHIDDPFSMVQYHLYILELEKIETSDKFTCLRKQFIQRPQKQSKIFEIPNPNNSIDEILIEPMLIVQDINTSFQFFKVNGIIKTIEDFNQEKDYSNIIILRSFLYFLQYLFKNPSKTSLLVLFDISKIDFDNNSSNDIDNESTPQYLCFDFLYFIKQIYGIDIYFQFEDFLEIISTRPSIVSNIIQSNKEKILNDIICMDIIENDIAMKDVFYLLSVDIIKTISPTVNLVIYDKRYYIQKEVGSISKIREWKKFGIISSHPDAVVFLKYGKKDLKSAMLDNGKVNDEYYYGIAVDDFMKSNELNILYYLLSKQEEPDFTNIERYYLENDKIYAMFPYVNGSCNLSEIDNLNEMDLLNILYQLCFQLHHLENLGIFHRDVKPENIISLRYRNGQIIVFIVDFGISQYKGKHLENYYSRDGTFGYQAPEIYREELRGDGDIKTQEYKMDVFSLGCTMAFLIKKFNISSTYLNDIIDKMTQPHYKDRFSIDQCLKIFIIN
ncbi:hypothetical protein ACTFIW_003226 [Dictyostelium discoideum]